jgi:hypothetical protein
MRSLARRLFTGMRDVLAKLTASRSAMLCLSALGIALFMGLVVADHSIARPDVRWPLRMLLLVACVCQVFVAIAFQRHWDAEQWAKVGFCRSCGYDLRAGEGRCPHCGRVAVVRPAASGHSTSELV